MSILNTFLITGKCWIRKSDGPIVCSQMLKGGISDPRNKALMKMFNLIAIGERAGSGVPDIYSVWNTQGWDSPAVTELFNPDRTRLTLPLIEKQAKKTSEEEKSVEEINQRLSWID